MTVRKMLVRERKLERRMIYSDEVSIVPPPPYLLLLLLLVMGDLLNQVLVVLVVMELQDLLLRLLARGCRQYARPSSLVHSGGGTATHGHGGG